MSLLFHFIYSCPLLCILSKYKQDLVLTLVIIFFFFTHTHTGIEKNGHVLRLTINNNSVGGFKKVAATGTAQFVLTPSRDVELNEDCQNMITEVSTGLKQAKGGPMRTDVLDCTGGVYFMRNVSGQKYAVFKPHDEEQGMPNNGKGYDGNGETSLRPHFKPGQGCIREVAAYIMDVGNFTGVPATTMVHCEHPTFLYPSSGGKQSVTFPKLGSLQKFFVSDGTFEDIGSSMISDFEVQKIALFDMRLLNCDRNASNILVAKKSNFNNHDSTKGNGHGNSNTNTNANTNTHRRNHRSCSLSSWESQCSDEWMEESRSDDDTFLRLGIQSRCNSDNTDPGTLESRGTENGGNIEDASPISQGGNTKDKYLLIPIDHGYSLPTALDIKEWDWSWFHLPHIKRPVHPEIKKYLLSIDFEELAANLTSQVSISDDSMFLLRLSHRLLVSGIKAGLTLYDIASLIARLDEDEPSSLERAISVAEENAHRAIEMRSSSSRSGGGSNASSLNGSPKEREFVQHKVKSKVNSHTQQTTLSTNSSGTEMSSSNESLGDLVGDSEGQGLPLSMDDNESNHRPDIFGAAYGIGVGLGEGTAGQHLGGGSLMRLESMKFDRSPIEGMTMITPSKSKPNQLPPSWLPKSPKSPPATTLSSLTLPFPSEVTSNVKAPSTVSPKSGTARHGYHENGWIKTSLSSLTTTTTLPQSCKEKKGNSPPLDSLGGAGQPPSPMRRFGSHNQLVLESTEQLNLSYPSTPTSVVSGSTDKTDNNLSVSTTPNSRSSASDTKPKLTKSSSRGRLKSPTQRTRKKKGEIVTTGNAVGNEADVDTDTEISSNEEAELQHGPMNLVRVSSFTAFSSFPLYDVESSERRFGKLFREKRRLQVSTKEFRGLRQRFADDRVGILISKIEKSNNNNNKSNNIM